MTALAGNLTVVPQRIAWRWGIVTVYFAAICLLHLQFSLWLTAERNLPWGPGSLAELVPPAALAGAAALLAVVLWQLRRAPHPVPLAAGWLLWVAAVLAIDRWLTFSLNEALHYPQYALLALLVARALDPTGSRRIAGRVLFWTTLAGAGDELLQYLWITSEYSYYFDFNDVIVNLVAAAAGVLLHVGSAPVMVRSRALPPRLEIGVSAAIALIVGVALSLGRLQLDPPHNLPPGGIHRDADGRWVLYLQRHVGQYGSLQPGPRRGEFYVLPPRRAFPALVLTAALFTMLAAVAGRRGDPGDVQSAISLESA